MPFDHGTLGRVFFQLEMPPFNSYLETISEFLKNETKKHREEIDNLREQIKIGKITPNNESDEEPWEYQYEQHIDYLIGEIQEFENILLKSFFVTIYGFLESQLMQRCRKLKKESESDVLAVSDIRGDDTIDRAMKYLIKIQRLGFRINKHSAEWKNIREYGPLRNCLVHNEGRLDESFEEKPRKRLINFLAHKDSGLHVSGVNIVLTKEFCKDAWRTIEEFLWQVDQAETQAKA